jgi:hypothetical protein
MYESLILQKQIDALKIRELLEYDDGPWAANEILATKYISKIMFGACPLTTAI